ncbi:MAG: DUF2269 family protein [Solirubrobacterales bacterium]|nr:DUF2269 family protein [Solirubrobacterales bacterium]
MIATASVQFYDVVLFFHIAAVVIGLGPTFAYAAYLTAAQREGQGLAMVARTNVFWNRTVNTGAMTLILLTGIYLAADGPYGMGSFFISWGFVAIIFLLGVTHAYFIPKTNEAIAIAERDQAGGGEVSADYRALDSQIAKVGIFTGLVIIVTIYIMTAKPFL